MRKTQQHHSCPHLKFDILFITEFFKFILNFLKYCIKILLIWVAEFWGVPPLNFVPKASTSLALPYAQLSVSP